MKHYHETEHKQTCWESELTQFVERRTRDSYVPEYEPTEQEALGMVISNHFLWNGIAICECFANALEDANFHGECATVRDWLTKWTKGGE